MDLKLKGLLLIVSLACISTCYVQLLTDRSYSWHVFASNYRINEKGTKNKKKWIKGWTMQTPCM